MNNTYQKHYFASDPNHAGLDKLFQLATELQNRGDTIMEEYNKVGLSLKKLDQNDVNQFLCDEVTYHDNLYALSKYGTTENAKYRNLQIKSIQDTERLLSTSFWDPSNWTGELTSLDKTAPIIKKVCERTANES